ncbi:MAG: PIG-L deacetylase family protein, partial [bacterium]
ELELAALFRREKPHVVVTFHGSGISFHPDHRIVSLATMGAFLGAGREGWYREEPLARLEPHAPDKLYGFVPPWEPGIWSKWPREIYRAFPDEITTVIDTAETADTKWEAIRAHHSQKDGPPFRVLWEAGAFRREAFVRIFPSPRPGDPEETDLLSGLS